MKKTFTQIVGLRFTALSVMFAIVCGIVMPISALAEIPEDVPRVMMFYPSKEEKPMEFKPNASAYIYFMTGSQVLEAKARVVQNEVDLGTIVFAGSVDFRGNPSSTCTMKASKEENKAALDGIQAGTFDFEVYEVTYRVDGVDKTYSDIDNPVDKVTYFRNIANGSIVKEEGLSNKRIKSYYPLDSDLGTKTYYFDKQIKPEGVYANFQYGQGNTYILTDIDCSVASDGMSVTVDLRGHCYSNDVLAPGITWVDDFGNPIPDPTEITVIIYNLNCVDGTRIGYNAKSLDGMHTTYLEGQIWDAFYYDDLTFPTPVISLVQFYDNAAPAVKYNSMGENTDMLSLYINNIEYLSSADVVLTYGGVTATIPNDQIQKSDKYFNVEIPASIRQLGSDKLVVSLENVIFTAEDGADHDIRPYTFSNVTKEVLSIADFNEVEAGTEVVLNTVEGVKVTLSNEMGYTFVEDATGALQVVTDDYTMLLNQGTTVVGSLFGTYLGYGVFMINPKASEYTETYADINMGMLIDDAETLADPSVANHLVTIVASESLPIAQDKVSGYYVIAGSVVVMTEFVDDFDFEGSIDNITGVLFVDPNLNQSYLLIRGQYDINKVLGDEPLEVTTIAGIKELGDEAAVISLTDVTVTYVDEMMGLSVIEDETGALVVYEEMSSPILTMGTKVSLKMTGTYYGDCVFETSLDNFVIVSSEDADVSTGANIPLDQISDESNVYRLVTFNNTEETPLKSTPYAVNVGKVAQVVDYYYVLGDEYEFPAEVESVTGIILPAPQIFSTDDDFDSDFDVPSVTLIGVRGIEDIVASTTGIEVIPVDTLTETAVYTIKGVKVREAGEDLNGLNRGIYIAGGKKVIIK